MRGLRVQRGDRRAGRGVRADARSRTSAASAARSQANVLSLAAMRATLGEVLTDDAFAHMIALGERFEQGVQAALGLVHERLAELAS